MLNVTSLWVFWQNHRQRVGVVLSGLLIFLAGWQLGRVTSPYYAAQPIIFQERDCSGGNCGNGGSLTQLEALQEESAGSSVNKTTGSDSTGTVAGLVTSGVFVASVNSNLYHHKDCSTAGRIKLENQLWFQTAQEAEAAGYTASACTRDKSGN